jgi:hypothetical protein
MFGRSLSLREFQHCRRRYFDGPVPSLQISRDKFRSLPGHYRCLSWPLLRGMQTCIFLSWYLVYYDVSILSLLYRSSAVTTNWLSVVKGERLRKPQERPSWTGPTGSLKFLWLRWSNSTLKQAFRKVYLNWIDSIERLELIVAVYLLIFRCFRVDSSQRCGHCWAANSSAAISIGSERVWTFVESFSSSATFSSGGTSTRARASCRWI